MEYWYFLFYFCLSLKASDTLPKGHLRHVLLFHFKENFTAIRAHGKINHVYGQGSLSLATAYRWFHRFEKSDFSLEEEARGGSVSDFNETALTELLRIDNKQSTRALGEQLKASHTTVITHLHSMGFVLKFGAWVPHVLTDVMRLQRLTVSAALLSRYNRYSFLPHVITGDEKWVLYVNYRRHKQWIGPGEQPKPEPKPELHQKKIMLCIWWDLSGVVYWELLPEGTTVRASLYSEQLDRVAEQIKKNRPNHGKVLLLHDNARPHVANLTQKKLKDLGWEVLPHPPYSPDLAPSDFHLFRKLAAELDGERFGDRVEVENWLRDFFAAQPKNFWEKGIRALPNKWQRIIDNNGDYLE